VKWLKITGRNSQNSRINATQTLINSLNQTKVGKKSTSGWWYAHRCSKVRNNDRTRATVTDVPALKIGQLGNDFDAETKPGENMFPDRAKQLLAWVSTKMKRITFFSAILLEEVMRANVLWLSSLVKIPGFVLQQARGLKDSEAEGKIFFGSSVIFPNSF